MSLGEIGYDNPSFLSATLEPVRSVVFLRGRRHCIARRAPHPAEGYTAIRTRILSFLPVMFKIDSSQLFAALHVCRPDGLIEVRNERGDLVHVATNHEGVVLAEHGCVEGWSSRHGLRYLRLTVPPRVAFAHLRRALARGGRTVSEA